jgi:hypothetical protein
MRMTAAKLTLGVFLLATTISHAQARHEVFTQDIEIFDTILNPCNGEAVTLSGIAKFREQYTFTADGGLDFYAHDNNQGVTGIGESGTRYMFVGGGDQFGHFTDATQDGTLGTFVVNANLISQSNTANALIRTEFVFMRVNGEFFALVDNFSATCQPG